MPTKLYVVTSRYAAPNTKSVENHLFAKKGEANKFATSASKVGYNSDVKEGELVKMSKKPLLVALFNQDLSVLENIKVLREVKATAKAVKEIAKKGRGLMPPADMLSAVEEKIEDDAAAKEEAKEAPKAPAKKAKAEPKAEPKTEPEKKGGVKIGGKPAAKTNVVAAAVAAKKAASAAA